MKLPILIRNDDSSIVSFIDCWKKFYEPDENEVGDKDTKYSDNLKPLKEMNADNIQKLFEWKNGMRLSVRKQESVDRIKHDLENIATEFEKSGFLEEDLEKIYTYSNKFFKDGYIWNLFFLHILKYDKCPIADMYAYKAYNYICNGENELPVYNWDTYIKYMHFFNKIADKSNQNSKESRKEIDEALWGFGKFLDNYPKIILEGGKIDI